jgi:hypothetical protein
MKNLIIAILALSLHTLEVRAEMIVISFDENSNWIRSPGVAISSYATDHLYRDQGFTFTGGPALRNGTGLQHDVAGALGTYSWRLRDAPVVWTATYSMVSMASIGSVGFDARRWDDSPSPNFSVDYSVNGGSSFQSLAVLNNTAFDDSSAWKTFRFDVNTPTLDHNDFVIRITNPLTSSPTNNERILIDNFTVTGVPEPTSLLLVALSGLVGFAGNRYRTTRAERCDTKNSGPIT